MTGAIGGAAALFVVGLALMAIAPALKILGSMSWEEIGRGLLALSGVLIILGVAGSVLGPVVPTLLALGGAMLLIGLGLALAGVGLLAFSAGLAALAVSGAAGVGALVIIISSIISLVPMIVETLGRAILGLIDVLVKGAPTLLAGVVVLLNILLDGLILLIPKLIDAVLLFLDTLLTKVAEKLPSIVKAGFDIIVALLTGIRDNIAQVATIAYDIVINFINAVATKLPELVAAGYDFIIKYIDALAAAVEKYIPRIMSSVRKLGIAIVKGVLEGMLGARKEILDGIIDLANTILKEFKATLGIHSPSTEFEAASENIVAGLVSGISKYGSRVYASAQNMGDNVVSQFDTVASRIADNLNGNMELAPTITPVIDFTNIDKVSSRMDGIFANSSLNAKVALDTSKSISSGIKQTGTINSSPSTGEVKPTGETPITFIQNNQSPKALSPIEIYRNTKNLLSKTRTVVGAQ
jgi:hypothetical protein